MKEQKNTKSLPAETGPPEQAKLIQDGISQNLDDARTELFEYIDRVAGAMLL